MLPGGGFALRGQLEIPDRRISMTMSLCPNSDKTLPASHIVEMVFKVSTDFPFGGISNVLGILMKEAEETRGAPLAVASVKITPGIFLIGVSATESDMQRNRELLDGRSWFDIAIIYDNGRLAILAIEKGAPARGRSKQPSLHGNRCQRSAILSLRSAHGNSTAASEFESGRARCGRFPA
jgi:hypothetical protein